VLLIFIYFLPQQKAKSSILSVNNFKNISFVKNFEIAVKLIFLTLIATRFRKPAFFVKIAIIINVKSVVDSGFLDNKGFL